jgi:fructokinase
MFLVCGEALYDVFPGEELVDGGLSLEARAGGSPFNLAIGLARLGTPVAFFAGLSRDPLGERLFQRLRAEGVDTRFIVRKDGPTTLSLVGRTPEGAPAYTFYGREGADRDLTASDLPTLSRELTGLHVGSYAIVAEPAADAFARLTECEAGKRLISLDLNVRPTVEPDMKVWRRRIGVLAQAASLIKASSEDLSLLWPGRSVESITKRWIDAGVPLVVVTLGEKGAVAYTAAQAVVVGGVRAKVVDTVGAGDAFQAALLHGLARRKLTSKAELAGLGHAEIRALLSYANRAAALACTRRGADLPRAWELEPLPGDRT